MPRPLVHRRHHPDWQRQPFEPLREVVLLAVPSPLGTDGRVGLVDQRLKARPADRLLEPLAADLREVVLREPTVRQVLEAALQKVLGPQAAGLAVIRPHRRDAGVPQGAGAVDRGHAPVPEDLGVLLAS